MSDTTAKVGVFLWLVRYIVKPFIQAFDTEVKKEKIGDDMLDKLAAMSKERLDILVNEKTVQEVIGIKAEMALLQAKVTTLQQELTVTAGEMTKLRDVFIGMRPVIETLRTHVVKLHEDDVRLAAQLHAVIKKIKEAELVLANAQMKTQPKTKAKEVDTQILDFS